MTRSSAQAILWRIPEVVERMFSGLDPASALHLVQANLMNKETLQKSLSLKAWKQVVAGSKDKYGLLKKEDVSYLVEILRLAKLKEQSKECRCSNSQMQCQMTLYCWHRLESLTGT